MARNILTRSILLGAVASVILSFLLYSSEFVLAFLGWGDSGALEQAHAQQSLFLVVFIGISVFVLAGTGWLIAGAYTHHQLKANRSVSTWSCVLSSGGSLLLGQLPLLILAIIYDVKTTQVFRGIWFISVLFVICNGLVVVGLGAFGGALYVWSNMLKARLTKLEVFKGL